MGGFSSAPERVAGRGAREVLRGSVIRGALVGVGLEATVLVPAARLLPGLRLPWGMMPAVALALPLVLAVGSRLMPDVDAPPSSADAGGRSPAADTGELPASLGRALYLLAAASSPVIGAGGAALLSAGGTAPSRVAGAMAAAAALGPGAVAALLLRRHDGSTPGRILLNLAATVGIIAFLPAAQWTALWILMPDPGWIG